jgi:hypothetical protein
MFAQQTTREMLYRECNGQLSDGSWEALMAEKKNNLEFWADLDEKSPHNILSNALFIGYCRNCAGHQYHWLCTRIDDLALYLPSRVNEYDDGGLTPLMRAVWWGLSSTIHILLNRPDVDLLALPKSRIVLQTSYLTMQNSYLTLHGGDVGRTVDEIVLENDQTVAHVAKMRKPSCSWASDCDLVIKKVETYILGLQSSLNQEEWILPELKPIILAYLFKK